MSQLDTEVLIIGGGVLGAAVARELSKYKVDVTLVDKDPDFGWGMSKASANIVCQGGDCLEFRKEYHRSKLVWESIPLMEPLCQELSVPFKRVGELGLIKNNDHISKFIKMRARAKEWNVSEEQFIDRDTLRKMEPNLTKDAIGALFDPNVASLDGVRFVIALAENARQNGAKTMLNTEVVDITPGADEFEVTTNQGTIKSRYIVNAAGDRIDKIAAMVNADDFIVVPVKACLSILDKKVQPVSHVIYNFPAPGAEMN